MYGIGGYYKKSKITKSLAIFASVLLIVFIGVASFAYFGTFNANLNNNVAVNNEIAMAGGVYGTNNNNYYLYTNQFYWLGSHNYFESINGVGVFIVSR